MTSEEEIEESDRLWERKMLGLPRKLIHRQGNTYFTKLGRLITADLIVDEHGRWIGAIFQDELKVDDQDKVADKIVRLWNSEE
jgi:hypothetical protein